MKNFGHNCGVFGVSGSPSAAALTFTGLFALQHRGQESSGIVSSNGQQFFEHKGMGLVPNVFTPTAIASLAGNIAIGHNRYSTTGNSELRNAQPLTVECWRGPLAIGHNGNLTNTVQLRENLVQRGANFQTTTDSEIILHLLTMSHGTLVQAIVDMMNVVEGAYSLVIMTRDSLIAVRDPLGFHPLSLGRLNGAWIIASETCAFDAIGATFERDVKPGEIVVIKDGAIESFSFNRVVPRRTFCSFEAIYFMRPDSLLFGKTVADIRIAFGAALAREHQIDADVVVPVPDSGIYAAWGYANTTRIPFVLAYVRNHYLGRSFLQPVSESRVVAVDMKLNLIRSFVEGKRVIVLDDSIVRGNTAKSRCRLIKEAGATEVHMLVSCPPHRHPCFYGIDFPSADDLIANHHSNGELARLLGLDSLGYLSEDSMARAIGDCSLCLACFNGKYPTPVPL